MARPRPRSFAALLSIGLAGAACEGEIGESQMYVPGEGLQDPPPAGQDGGVAPPDAGPPFDPFAMGGVTIGVVCTPEGPETRMVFTASVASCARHAEILAGGVVPDGSAVVATPQVSGPTQFEANGELCLEGDCAAGAFDVEIDAYGPSGAIGRWTTTTQGRTATGPLQATVCNYDAFLPGGDPSLAPDLAVSEVALYQGVKVPLTSYAEAADRPVAVIAGRPGLIRVFVEPQAGYTAQQITAELTWDRGDGSEVSRRQETLQVAGASRDGSRASTFDFELEGADVTEGARWAVSLRAQEACAGASGDTSGARVPAADTLALEPEEVGTYNVVLVPIRYAADGSNRLPDISEEQLERYRRKIFGMYPVPELNLTVRDPVTWERVIARTGQGWSEILQALLGLRMQDAPAPNTFYYGIFAPADSIRQFCGRGCVAGLGTLPSPGDELRRGAVGLGFSGEGATNTAAHELGHAAGRPHAPCQVRDADPNYPHAEASIGVWGYDITNGSLKSPATYKDVMSYCDPEWISDYNYRELYERISFVNRNQQKVLGTPAPWRMITFTAEGPAWGEIIELDAPPHGDPVAVRYFDDLGQLIGVDEGVEFGLDHLDDTIAVIPAAPARTFGVEVGAHELVLY